MCQAPSQMVTNLAVGQVPPSPYVGRLVRTNMNLSKTRQLLGTLPPKNAKYTWPEWMPHQEPICTIFCRSSMQMHATFYLKITQLLPIWRVRINAQSSWPGFLTRHEKGRLNLPSTSAGFKTHTKGIVANKDSSPLPHKHTGRPSGYSELQERLS